MITLRGSCSCRAVRFSVRSETYYPYQYCYCSICRKTQGGGGYAINLGADARTLKITGKEKIRKYFAVVKNPEDKRGVRSKAERCFCRVCGSGLWLFDPEWPELLHPFASAIDTKLPVVPEHTHLLLEFKAPWVELHATRKDKKFKRFPKESIREWHERLGFLRPEGRRSSGAKSGLAGRKKPGAPRKAARSKARRASSSAGDLR